MPETETAVPSKVSPVQKAMLLQAIVQLDMLCKVFGNAPERVQKAATEFRDSLKEWSDA